MVFVVVNIGSSAYSAPSQYTNLVLTYCEMDTQKPILMKF